MSLSTPFAWRGRRRRRGSRGRLHRSRDGRHGRHGGHDAVGGGWGGRRSCWLAVPYGHHVIDQGRRRHVRMSGRGRSMSSVPAALSHLVVGAAIARRVRRTSSGARLRIVRALGFAVRCRSVLGQGQRQAERDHKCCGRNESFHGHLLCGIAQKIRGAAKMFRLSDSQRIQRVARRLTPRRRAADFARCRWIRVECAHLPQSKAARLPQ